jgi:hypothetical protein
MFLNNQGHEDVMCRGEEKFMQDFDGKVIRKRLVGKLEHY